MRISGSSNSSISSGLENPSHSLEPIIATPQVQAAIQQQLNVSGPRQWVDSEDDTCLQELVPDWGSNVAPEVLQTLTDHEKKRQEIINGN